MNILVPDSWLREFLKTKATPAQIVEYLSLCGPSVERIKTVGNLPAITALRRWQAGDVVYEIEVTSNRPDSMSIMGIAREAAAILPRFGIAATFKGSTFKGKVEPLKTLKLNVKTDPKLNPRWVSAVFDNVKVGPSPKWLSRWLELTGTRSMNNVIDITNFLMLAYGQPAHVFDYDSIEGHTMMLRASKRGERVTTLDGKTHTLPGDDIVIADESGELIDLCGIMGGKNSAIKDSTKRVVLFLQTYDPSYIRKTSMALAHRTLAASLFEKGIDSELVMPVFLKGIEMMKELTGGKLASPVIDIYPAPYKALNVSVERSRIASYIGELSDKEIKEILASLGFEVTLSKDAISVKVPSFRRDVILDVDIIEEIARIWGYHNIGTRLPDGEPPVVVPDPQFTWEEEIKIRLRDWGFTELYTYSMISEEQMDIFGLDKAKSYKIANPLSKEWVYMRPVLWPSFLMALKENLSHREDLRLFELSNTYQWRPNELPDEYPVLVVAWTGDKFFEAKGLAEEIFRLFGIPFPNLIKNQPLNWYDPLKRLALGKYGSVGVLNQNLQHVLGIGEPITILDLLFPELLHDANPLKTYKPIPKYPPIIEDLAFIVPDRFEVGPLITGLKNAHPLISDVTLLDVHENTRTLHITYQDTTKNLTGEEIIPIREKLITLARDRFGLTLKTT